MNDDGQTIFMKLEWGPNWIHRLLRPTLAIVSIVLLLIAAKFGYSENPAGMAAAATPALFCLVFVFLPYFSEVAILGFKAKLLDQKIVEAESALTHLKSIAVIVARAAYQTLIYGNRMTSIPVDNKRQVATELDQILRSLSIDGSVLKLERDKFLDMHMFDIALFVEQAFRIKLDQLNQQRARGDGGKEWDALTKELRELVRSVDVQDVAKRGQSKRFFETLSRGLETVDFSAAPDEKRVLVNLVEEAASLCEDIRAKGEITDAALSYLVRWTNAESAKEKLQELARP